MKTFQQIIQILTQFWADRGCIVHQGHDVEVGAGTFNPATFLKSLGPEPYNTVYVEPSRRPQDGRYGENPNRLQLFHQLQVVMKPSPSDIQNTYLESIKALGFDLSGHDIRFVHDDWESPTLGAWGLGWEVWIDGMEVTQFTYFQSVAGLDLKPVPVEITYGLERLCMLLQQVDNFFDMRYNDTLFYKDVFHRSEVEWSYYNFNYSTAEMWQRHFEDFEKEAKNLINLNLPIPAYDFVMKASHAFNMLEARGVISTTERTGYIHRIRELAKLSAIEYLASREKLGFPLLSQKPAEKVALPAEESSIAFNPANKRDFLLEIGTEQLPATFISIGMKELQKGFEAFLHQNNLDYGSLKTLGTPQRLAILIKEVSEGSAEYIEERRGPQLSVAFDDTGCLTKQGQGFVQALGTPEILLKDLDRSEIFFTQEINGKPYLFAKVKKKSLSTFSLLQTFLPKLISNLSFPKSMRWADFDMPFARPVHSLLCLFGNDIIPFSLWDITSDRLSLGHAQRSLSPITIEHPDQYEGQLKKHFVIADPVERKNVIESELNQLLSGKNWNLVKKEQVLNEVLYLTEWPELCIHSFKEDFLKAPDEVLISEMVNHQRYFPLIDRSTSKLVPYFIITADNKINEEIKKNNEAVLSARLSDGLFLYEQDLKHTLDAFNDKLKNVTFHKDLGSVFDKVKRIKKTAIRLNAILQVADDTALSRAAHLCKADLSTDMVGEFPELQGIMGMHYALHQKEPQEIAIAIKEHWMPLSEKGELPSSVLGKILSLADKIDNICSYYSIGIKPTSSKDPYALRRQTLGIIRILIDSQWSIDLHALFLEITGKKHLTDEIREFFLGRMKTVFEELSFAKDEVEASLAYSNLNPFQEYAKLKALQEFRKTSSDFNGLIEVYKRAKGQIEAFAKQNLVESLLSENAEKSLFIAIKDVDKPFIDSLTKNEYKRAFELLTKLKKPLAELFDHVQILDSNEEIKNNRIALLQEVFEPFTKLIDLGKLQIK